MATGAAGDRRLFRPTSLHDAAGAGGTLRRPTGRADRFGQAGRLQYFQERYGIAPERFAYIPNGFLPGDSGGALPEAVRELRGRYRFLVGYTGALSAYYGLEDLLALAERLADMEGLGFVLVGKGDFADRLRGRAAAAGLKHVHFIGAVPKSEVPPVIEAFDVCYVGLRDLPVHRYGISCNKIYEYMHAGKPIVGSYLAGHDPVAAADCGFTAAPGDHDSLARAVRNLMVDEGLRSAADATPDTISMLITISGWLPADCWTRSAGQARE